jgi:hypothetical protein
MYMSMQKVKSLGLRVKGQAEDIRDWMESFEELGTKVDDDIRETWKTVLEDWKVVLKSAKEGTKEVRDELNAAIAQVLDMRGTLEGMGATAENNANKHMAEVQKEYDAVVEEIAANTGCNWAQAIFTLGIWCLVKDGDKRKAEKTLAMIGEKSKDLQDALKPIIADLSGIESVADGLLRAGYDKLEAVNDFLDALVVAESHFTNGGKLFSKPARRRHVEKLDILIAACNTMLVHATTKMAVFRAVIVGGDDFAKEAKDVDGQQYEK